MAASPLGAEGAGPDLRPGPAPGSGQRPGPAWEGSGPGHFDLCGPLPSPGVTVLEASAGTGKTFTIAALVTRMVAQGVASLDQILVVTFTRMATSELRDRARQTLAATERALARELAVRRHGVGQARSGPVPGAPAELVDMLAQGCDEEVGARRQRLADALSNFDSATITTTHGFCHAMLEALASRGQVAPGASLLEEPGELVNEVVNDLYVRGALAYGAPPFSRMEAYRAGWEAVANPGTQLEPPADRADGSPPGLRRRFAATTRTELDQRLVDANLLTYDGLLGRLVSALSDPQRGQSACQRLRQRYRVVLVDEFQDTDLVQWEVVRLAFTDGATTLVLIGDPKQAVYGFRGADIYAYLAAAQSAPPRARFTLERNWRSDLDLLAAYNALLTPLQLGHPDIRFRAAHAIEAHARPGLRGGPAAPLRVRVVDGQAPWARRTPRGALQKGAAVQLVAQDLARDIVSLLSCGAELVQWEAGGDEPVEVAPVRPGDIGVLVRTNRQAGVVQDALREVGVPAVVAGAESVLTTAAARHWLDLLSALEQPASRPLAVPVALGPFVGLSAERVATAGEDDWEQLHDQLHRWSAVVRQLGVASLYADVTGTTGLPARLLATQDGERLLTDLGHITELLHAQATTAQLGLAALRSWLAGRAGEVATEGTDAQARSRRLDSDSDAVHLLTVHRAKGLEFPIVYCPYLWDVSRPQYRGAPVVYHDGEDGWRRKLDVGGDGSGPAYQRHFQAHLAELRGEELRHLYVALTRARHQAVLWWAGVTDSQHSALARLLLRRDAAGAVAVSGQRSVPSESQVRQALEVVAKAAPGLVSIEAAGPGQGRRWPGSGSSIEGPHLGTAQFGRPVDYLWRRSSFTSITARAHGPSVAAVGSEPETPYVGDEPTGPAGALVPGDGLAGSELPDDGLAGSGLADDGLTADREAGDGVAGDGEASDGPVSDGSVADGDDAQLGGRSLLDGVPAGAEMGTLVHRALEEVDFTSPRLREDLFAALSRPVPARPWAPEVLATLAQGLAAAVHAPLGPGAGVGALSQLSRADRLDELAFELPIAGGDPPRADFLLADLADLWRKHVPPGDPLRGYGELLGSPELVPRARGYLTGSLDLVYRSRADSASVRYLVADYKTNWLGPAGAPLMAWHYRAEALRSEMLRAHYPLQAIFYVVALHRYLRWRLRGYRPDAHLGGVAYLFLRGMSAGPPSTSPPGQQMPARPGPSQAAPGPQSQAAPGVFYWLPPVGLVLGLSQLLAGRS